MIDVSFLDDRLHILVLLTESQFEYIFPQNVFKGLDKQSDIGLLSLFEHYKSCEVSKTLESWHTTLEQTPRRPTNDLSTTKTNSTNGNLTDRLNLTNYRPTSKPINLTNKRRIETDQ